MNKFFVFYHQQIGTSKRFYHCDSGGYLSPDLSDAKVYEMTDTKQQLLTIRNTLEGNMENHHTALWGKDVTIDQIESLPEEVLPDIAAAIKNRRRGIYTMNSPHHIPVRVA